jgi:predicted HTH domain antitoxin
VNIVQTVNVRQFKNNPSEALREAKDDLVIVMNRDQPTAALVGLELIAGTADLPRIRFAMAISMFKQKTLSISAAAKFAGKPLSEMLTMVSAAGIPVVDYPASELDEELVVSKRFERK